MINDKNRPYNFLNFKDLKNCKGDPKFTHGRGATLLCVIVANQTFKTAFMQFCALTGTTEEFYWFYKDIKLSSLDSPMFVGSSPLIKL